MHGALDGRAAYDAWHTHLYLTEIAAYRAILAGDRPPLPRPEKNVLLYLLMAALPGRAVTELGSSLLEVIDGLRAVDHLTGPWPSRPPLDVPYRGIESSPTFRRFARALYPQATVTATVRVAGGILYDRAVSSYAFRTARAAAACFNGAEAALCNLLLSRGASRTTERTPFPATWFSARELVAGLDKPLWHLFGRRNSKLGRWRPVAECFEGFFLVGTEAVARAFLRLAQDCPLDSRVLRRLTLRPALDAVFGGVPPSLQNTTLESKP